MDEKETKLPEKGKCEQQGCTKEGELMFYPQIDENPPESVYLCSEHQSDNGFCINCHGFFGGLESFEFPVVTGNVPGLCEECSDILRSEVEEYDEDDEDNYLNVYF